MHFNPTYIEMFTGGTFELGKHNTVADLKDQFQKIIDELEDWDAEAEIADVHPITISVVLMKGMVK